MAVYRKKQPARRPARHDWKRHARTGMFLFAFALVAVTVGVILPHAGVMSAAAEGGTLTEKVRRRPYCVVLFDELEKAHPDVLNILLQILDDGRITDAQGRVVNFENTVIVMTSNAGSDRRDGSVGFGRSLSEQSKDKAMKALSEFLRPEFLNRVDEIICFNRLSEENFRSIAGIMLGELRENLEEHGVALRWDESVIDRLVKTSYSVTYGARNLRRTIQREIEDGVAEKIIDSFEAPISQIALTAADDKIQITAS